MKYLRYAAVCCVAAAMSGCLEENAPRQVIAGFAAAEAEEIDDVGFDSDVIPVYPRVGPVADNARRMTPDTAKRGGGGFFLPQSKLWSNIPPPWLPLTDTMPWYYRNNFYYQWPMYLDSYRPEGIGPFDTYYNRYGEPTMRNPLLNGLKRNQLRGDGRSSLRRYQLAR